MQPLAVILLAASFWHYVTAFSPLSPSLLLRLGRNVSQKENEPAVYYYLFFFST
jgi:hypothetical protein